MNLFNELQFNLSYREQLLKACMSSQREAMIIVREYFEWVK